MWRLRLLQGPISDPHFFHEPDPRPQLRILKFLYVTDPPLPGQLCLDLKSGRDLHFCIGSWFKIADGSESAIVPAPGPWTALLTRSVGTGAKKIHLKTSYFWDTCVILWLCLSDTHTEYGKKNNVNQAEKRRRRHKKSFSFILSLQDFTNDKNATVSL